MSATRPMCAQWFMDFHAASDSTPGAHYVVRFNQGKGPNCTCPAFKRSQDRAVRIRRPDWIPSCKHVVRVMAHACLWNQHYEGGDRALPPASGTLRARISPRLRCPACGGPVVEVVKNSETARFC